MSKRRVAFELQTELDSKLKALCKHNNQSVSEYMRGLIVVEYQRLNSKQPQQEVNSESSILNILKQIEENTRP